MCDNTVIAVCCEQLSKIIKHLQSQLEHQEAVGASLDGQLATALGELHRLQAFEASQQELIEQAHAEGVQVGRRELAQERHLKQRLEKMLDRTLTEQQAAGDREAAAAVEAAAHVASLEQFIQDLKSQTEATLKSKLKVDRRNADLQRRHDSLKEDAQHTQHALASSQEQVAALEDRLHVLRRMNSQLERSESNAQQRTANAQHQVKLIDEERKLLVTMLHDQAASAISEPSALAPVPATSQTRLQRSISDGTALPGSLQERFTETLSCSDTQDEQPGQSQAGSSQSISFQQALAKEASQQQLVDSTIAEEVHLDAQVQPKTEIALVSAAQKMRSESMPQLQLRGRNMSALPFDHKQHVQQQSSTGLVAKRRENMYSEQKAYWHTKEALCPNIKNCIQEVQQLRAQLSQDSASLFSEKAL
ncbi:TPA: hypothetical protein ACH3X1_004735 [Trebouxia sp. C0004]